MLTGLLTAPRDCAGFIPSLIGEAAIPAHAGPAAVARVSDGHYSLAAGSTNSRVICSSRATTSDSVVALPEPTSAISSTPASQ